VQLEKSVPRRPRFLGLRIVHEIQERGAPRGFHCDVFLSLTVTQSQESMSRVLVPYMTDDGDSDALLREDSGAFEAGIAWSRRHCTLPFFLNDFLQASLYHSVVSTSCLQCNSHGNHAVLMGLDTVRGRHQTVE
jgi:hypothetical protein